METSAFSPARERMHNQKWLLERYFENSLKTLIGSTMETNKTKEMYQFLLLLLSRFSRVQLFATPWTAANQVPPSMRFSRQEYCRGLPLPSPITILKGRDYILIMSICISLMMYEADHLFVYMFVICTFFYCFLAY